MTISSQEGGDQEQRIEVIGNAPLLRSKGPRFQYMYLYSVSQLHGSCSLAGRPRRGASDDANHGNTEFPQTHPRTWSSDDLCFMTCHTGRLQSCNQVGSIQNSDSIQQHMSRCSRVPTDLGDRCPRRPARKLGAFPRFPSTSQKGFPLAPVFPSVLLVGLCCTDIRPPRPSRPGHLTRPERLLARGS